MSFSKAEMMIDNLVFIIVIAQLFVQPYKFLVYILCLK